jgi:hypothetical protein
MRTVEFASDFDAGGNRREATPMRARRVIGGLSTVAGICLWLVGTAVPLSAHHAFAAEFDGDKPVEFSGTVTKVEWINPHV